MTHTLIQLHEKAWNALDNSCLRVKRNSTRPRWQWFSCNIS